MGFTAAGAVAPGCISAFGQGTAVLVGLSLAQSVMVSFGKAVLDYKKRRVEDLARKAEIVEFFGHKVFAINSPELVDDLCHYLANKKPPFAIAWHKRGNFLKVSMRSINFDVRKIAEKFSNGGGHREAAGFSIPANKKLPWKSLKK